MRFDYKRNSLSLTDAVVKGTVVTIGAGGKGMIGSLRLDLPTTGIPRLAIDT